MRSFNQVIIASCFIVFNIFLLEKNTSISLAQNIPELNQLNSPMNVQNPENKKDFIQQCSQNLQAQGRSPSQAESYCNCSADAVYEYLSHSNNGVSSEGDILDRILQCRVQHIPTDN